VATSVSYDPLGRVLSLIHAKGSAALNTQTYTYDQAGYLSSAANDISQPLITQAAAATVDQANELLTNGQTTYTNDANGNRLTETGPNGTLTYQWDSRNRLSSITDASGNTTLMHYDFARNLLEIDRTSSGSTTTQKFLVDSLTNVVSLTDTSGLPVSVLTGRSIDSHFASIDSAGNVSFGIGDTLGEHCRRHQFSGSHRVEIGL
jgi:YD repeat-containing protein